MSQSRNKRRLNNKAKEKEQAKVVSGMTMLQRYCLNGLSTGKITKDEMKEMCVYWIKDEIESLAEGWTEESAKKFLEERNYTIIKLDNNLEK